MALSVDLAHLRERASLDWVDRVNVAALGRTR